MPIHISQDFSELNSIMFRRTSLYLVVCLTVLYCVLTKAQDSPDYTALQDALDTARAKWKAEHVFSYDMKISRQCFCLVESLGPFTQSIVGDAVISVVPDNQFSDNLPTVIGLFDLIQDAINDKVAALTAEYDASLGYPTNVYIDRDFRIADEEIGYTTTLSNVLKKPKFTIPTPILPNDGFNPVVHKAKRFQWEILSKPDYKYKFERQCFCPKQFRGPFIITVQNRAIISAEYEDSSLGVVSQQIFKDLRTIDKLFELIADEADTADEVEVGYDSKFGYPTRTRIDRIAAAIDDEVTYVAELIEFL